MRVQYFAMGWVIMAALMCAIYLIKIPACAEDAVLIGAGRFESGRWSSYVCGPAADDFIP